MKKERRKWKALRMWWGWAVAIPAENRMYVKFLSEFPNAAKEARSLANRLNAARPEPSRAKGSSK